MMQRKRTTSLEERGGTAMPTIRNRFVVLAAVVLCAGAPRAVFGQAAGTLEHIHVHGSREMIVVLPDAHALTRQRVEHTFEPHDGNHGNRIRERFERKVPPFFSQHLEARP